LKKIGGKALVVVNVVSVIVDVIDAQKRADEHGIGIWRQMTLDQYESLGYTIIYIEYPDSI
jgi:hypothetical protein